MEVSAKPPTTKEDGDHYGLEPAGRRGASSVLHGSKLYLIGGYPSSIPSGIDVYDFNKCWWSVSNSNSPTHEALRTSGSSCVVINDSLFAFGGWRSGYRNSDVYQFDFNQLTWEKLLVANSEFGPMCKDKAGMVDYGDKMLCVFGGYGWPPFMYPGGSFHFQKGASYHWDSQHGLEIGWTNELHVLHIDTKRWYSPELSGSRPPPCAAFSFTKVDRHRVVLFGGRQLEERVDQLYILDMYNWHWNGPVVPAGPWPAKRSFHTACSVVDPSFIPCSHQHSPMSSDSRATYSWLPCSVPYLCSNNQEEEGLSLDPKLLVLWGMDNEGDPVKDCWILNVRTLSWQKVVMPDFVGPARIWASAAMFHPSPHEGVVLLTGGCQHNLFKYSEENLIENVHRASLLHFGLRGSLYRICLDYIAENINLFEPFVQHLPTSMKKTLDLLIQQLHNRQKNFTYYCSL